MFDEEFDPPLTRDLHPDEMLSLMEQIEGEGGYLLDEPCTGENIAYKVKRPDGSDGYQDALTTGCHNVARFLVPYEVPKEGGLAEKDYATVCAVDDGLAYWPRYKRDVDAIWKDTK